MAKQKLQPQPMAKSHSQLPAFLAGVAGLLLAIVAVYLFAQGRRGVSYSIVGAILILFAWFRLRRDVSAWALLPGAFLVAFYISRPQLLAQAAPIRQSWTFDIYALYVDGSLGFQPSIWAHHLIAHSRLTEVLIQGVYEALPLAIAAAYALNLATRRRWRVFGMMVLVAIVGVQCYKLLPICGPAYLPFGNECFYYHGSCSAAAFFNGAPHMISIDDAWARNGMPSLHMSWALLALLACRNKRIWRWILFAFAALTALATLAYGEHYLIDLAAACPFSVAIWFLCMGEGPLSQPARIFPIMAGSLLYLGWIWTIRFAPQIFYASPMIPWLAIGGSISFLLIVKNGGRLPNRTSVNVNETATCN